jgi:hypothetical protein
MLHLQKIVNRGSIRPLESLMVVASNSDPAA